MSYPGTSRVETVPCRGCGFQLDPELGRDGFHPDCAEEADRRNER